MRPDPGELSRLDPRAKRQLLATLLARNSREKWYPASFTQEALWFINQLNPNQTTFSWFPDIYIKGPLRVDVVEKALNEMIRRHEILRTRFPERDGAPVQLVEAYEPRSFPLIDLSHLADAEQRLETRRLSLDQPAIDLRLDPVVGVRLVRWGPQEHVLLFHVHHIIFDGWSLGVALRELATLYRAFASDQPSPLPDLPFQYGDFAVWQRRYLSGARLRRLEDYWQHRLHGLQPLDLPTDRPRSPKRTTNASAVQFNLSPHLNRRVMDFAQQEGVTLYMVLLAAFSEILHRFTGVSDIAVGSPVANRRRREFESLIGYFINMLVMRNDLSGDPSFQRLVKRVQNTTLEGLEHQDLTLDRVVNLFAPPRDLSRHPLFQVMFVLQNTPRSRFPMGELSVERAPWAQTAAATIFELTMEWRLDNGHLRGRLIYNRDLFERRFVTGLVNHYLHLLEEALLHPSLPLSSLSSLGTEEARLRHIGIGSQLASPPLRATVPDLFRASVLANPHAIAVEEADRCLTYAELDAWSDNLALTLLAHGAGPGIRVAVLLPRRLETLVVLLGIQKAGAAYTPLDPVLPVERIGMILADASPRILVTTEDRASHWHHSDYHLLSLQPGAPLPDLPDHQPHERLSLLKGIAPEDPAYLIYTSGSTGSPKGVQIHHEALLNYCLAAIETYGLRATDRMLQFSSLSFDAHIEEIFPTLLSGGTLVLRDERMIASLNAFSVGCESRKISVVSLPTGFWHEWSRAIESGYARIPVGLGTVILGGEALLPDRLRAWFEKTQGGIRLFNSYGPTETTVVATATELKPIHGGDYRAPIGRPLPGVIVKVVDKYDRLCPVGVPGELLIGGKTLSQGYAGASGLSSKAFFIDPVEGVRWYRSGDRVRWRPDDMLEFVGRIDAQLKIRGFRVEPAEVEGAILKHPLVERAVVVPYESDSGTRLAAYLALGVNSLEVGELRVFLKRHIPDYMIPTRIMRMAALPVNSSGKVAHELLPEPGSERGSELALDSQTSELEQRMIEIWHRIFDIPTIGRGDDFFDLGGDSLSALRLIMEVKKEFGVELSLGAFFSDSTLAGLTARIEEVPRVEPVQPLPPITRSNGITLFPLSCAQEEFYTLNRIDPNSQSLRIQAHIQIAGSLNPSVLDRTIEEVLMRHDILRTRFMEKDGRVYQEVVNEDILTLRYEDLCSLHPLSRQEALDALLWRELTNPFDITLRPPIAILLLRLAPDDHALIITAHPILLDTWSWNILVKELGIFYTAFSRDKSIHLRKPAIQFGDFAAWQRQLIRDAHLDEHLDYWQRRLKRSTLFSLPTDRPRRDAILRNLRHHHITLDPPLVARIKAEAKRNKTRPQVILLTALILQLERTTGATKIPIGLGHSGRLRNELAQSVGYYSNALILQTDMSGHTGMEDALARVKRTLSEALIYQDLPINLLERKLSLETEDHSNPLFRIAFNFLDDLEEVQDTGGINLRLQILKEVQSPTQQPDFSMTVCPGSQSFAVDISFFSELFETTSIVRFSEQWLHHLRLMACSLGEDMLNSQPSPAKRYQTLADDSRSPPLNLHPDLDKPDTRASQLPERVWLLNKGSDGTPLFCLYGLGGMVTPYRVLSRYLAPRPVFGIEALGLRGLAKPEDNIVLMAETALKALREIQPKGPYVICGWSMGGWIATEIAHTLIEQGETIQFLGLLDTPLIGKANLLTSATRGFAGQIMAKAAAGWGGISEKRIYQTLLAYGAVDETDDGLARRIKALIDAHRKALDNYVPRVYPGPVVYWKMATRTMDPLWKHWFPAMHVESTPGNHFSMLREPAVSSLASSLRDHLSWHSKPPPGHTGLA